MEISAAEFPASAKLTGFVVSFLSACLGGYVGQPDLRSITNLKGKAAGFWPAGLHLELGPRILRKTRFALMRGDDRLRVLRERGLIARKASRHRTPTTPLRAQRSARSSLREQPERLDDEAVVTRGRESRSKFMKTLIVAATAAAFLTATGFAAQAQTPGLDMQQKGSVQGSPGASGYAPGHLKKKGTVKGSARAYAPGRTTTGAAVNGDVDVKAGRNGVGAGARGNGKIK